MALQICKVRLLRIADTRADCSILRFGLFAAVRRDWHQCLLRAVSDAAPMR